MIFRLFIVCFFAVIWAVPAMAEYTRVVADCKGQGGEIQIWFTYLSAVGTPANNFNPKQVVYHLVFMGADGKPTASPALVLRAGPDLDAVSNDGLLKELSLIAPDRTQEMRLKLVIGPTGKSTGSALAQYVGINSPGLPGSTSTFTCGNLQPVLFQLTPPPAY
jgi:hypothetical protein